MRFKPLATFTAAALSLLATPVPAADTPASPCPVVVNVLNVKSTEGFILAAIYEATGWGEKSVAVARTAVTILSPTLCLRPPGTGRFAIRLFHDLNADGILQSNMLGLPTEPYGFSNDAPLQFGPPSFESAAFELKDSPVSQSITLR